MRVSELMTQDVFCCMPDEDMNRAAQGMWEGDFGVVPVVDAERRLVGIITDRDLCMAAYTTGRDLSSLRIGEAMASQVSACAPIDPLETALSTMRGARVRRLPVVDDTGRLAGILSLNDIAREAARRSAAGRRNALALEVARTLAIVSEPRKSCPIEETPEEEPQVPRTLACSVD